MATLETLTHRFDVGVSTFIAAGLTVLVVVSIASGELWLGCLLSVCAAITVVSDYWRIQRRRRLR